RSWQIRVRMEMSAQVLMATRWSMAAIADEFRYSNQTKWGQAFRANFGRSPLRYRKEYLKQNLHFQPGLNGFTFRSTLKMKRRSEAVGARTRTLASRHPHQRSLPHAKPLAIFSDCDLFAPNRGPRTATPAPSKIRTRSNLGDSRNWVNFHPSLVGLC